MNNKLNPAKILLKAGEKYNQLKRAKYPYTAPEQLPAEIQSDQVKSIVYVLCEEINKILENKNEK